jgi:hypothetical protein
MAACPEEDILTGVVTPSESIKVLLFQRLISHMQAF